MDGTDLFTDPRVLDATLEALHVISGKAKEYAKLADHTYHGGEHGTAARASARKEALYGVKHEVANRLVRLDVPDRVERHYYDHLLGQDADMPYLCVYIDGWSFHIPAPVVPNKYIHVEATRRITGWSDAKTKATSEMPFKTALLHLKALGYDVNGKIPRGKHRLPARGSSDRMTYVGWHYITDTAGELAGATKTKG